MSNKMQNSGDKSDKNKSTGEAEEKGRGGEDKEETNCLTVNQLCTVTLNADDSNTKQQDSSNLVSKCVELEKRVYQLQRDNDRMKKEIEHMAQENVKKKKSLKESQEWIVRCSTLVDPIIKELENKETVSTLLVRFAMGRTLMSYNIVDKISLVCEYANNVTQRFINLSNDLKQKDDRVRNLECQLRKTKEHFNQKAAKQLKIIKEAEAQQKKKTGSKEKY